MIKRTCSKCRKPLEVKRIGKHRYCLKCHAKYMRVNRKRYGAMTPEEKRKANARSMANVYQKRGRIKKKPCADCGKRATEKHHEDYSKALDVTWLCRPCHLKRHSAAREEIYNPKDRAQAHPRHKAA